MWNGYGVCSNVASSGEPPPTSHGHFNHWLEVPLNTNQPTLCFVAIQKAVHVKYIFKKKDELNKTEKTDKTCPGKMVIAVVEPRQ